MNNNIIEGNPTKKFFIEMITRDISIEDAIVDLLDNSIDGASQNNNNNFEQFYINITINENELVIEDNCGGFSLETAKKYAFRFGRPEEAPSSSNTIGRFGIGMKRSLFKMGKIFSIESQHKDEHFIVNVDVDKWSKQSKFVKLDNGNEVSIDDWSFEYSIIEHVSDFKGTIIHITELKDDVKELFKESVFLHSLASCIKRMLNFSLVKGLKIKLNDELLEPNNLEILLSDYSTPYFKEGEIEGVKYRIVAGIGDVGEPKKSGWYIFCNNRLVLEADTSSLTGWGVNSMPKWHVDFVMFRGIVFLDSAETINLPLTTTKKGIDATSIIYQKIMPFMRESMIKVIEFLKAIPKLRNEANDYRIMICESFQRLNAVEIKNYNFDVSSQGNFIPPNLDMEKIAQKKQTVRVAYDVSKNKAENAKKHADVGSYKDLGLMTFDYYTKMEEIDNE